MARGLQHESEKRCDKAESGVHEIDFEQLKFDDYFRGDAARFSSTCLHCGATGTTTVFNQEFIWREQEGNER